MSLQSIDPDWIPKPAADVKAEVIEGEVLLYHPAQTRAVYLNPSAALIWSLCDGQRSVREIIGLIAEGYPDSKPNLAEDVLATLGQLRDNRVLIVAGGAPATGSHAGSAPSGA